MPTASLSCFFRFTVRFKSRVLCGIGAATALLLTPFLAAETRVVNSTSNDPNIIGTLPYWLLNADEGDTIDCTPIAGEHIYLDYSLPAITKGYTINGAGVILDGVNSYQAFQIVSENVFLNNITVQHAISKGGDGGDGFSGGGGAVGGGGALYIHGGGAATLTTARLLNNIAQGGNGGAASATGDSGGGGGGGFGGGGGGGALSTVSSGGGGGGHSSGGNGGGSSSTTGSNGFYFGGGGGGAGINSIVYGGSGGNASPSGAFIGGSQSYGSGGGGAGASQDGFSAAGSGTEAVPGNGGNGIGVDLLFGGGGGGGGASESGYPGGAGVGAAGGGGCGGAGANNGGAGGILGGGGGGGLQTGGTGGFGAGGGGALIGGLGGGSFGAGGGQGGSDPISDNGGGGGGSGLGGAIFVQSNARLTIVDALEIAENKAIAGIGGSSTSSNQRTYIPPGDGAAMGQDIFLRQGASLIFDLSGALVLSNPIEGDYLTTPEDSSGSLVKKGNGVLTLTGANTYVGQTTVEQGYLCLNGSIENDLWIQKEGALSGNATVAGNIHNEGVLSPGNSVGVVSTTDLILSFTSEYRVEIEPTKADLIQASGIAHLSGSVSVFQNPGIYAAEGVYTILTASKGLTGSIDLLQVQALPGFQFYLEQSSSKLSLHYTLLLPPSNVQGKQVKNNKGIVNILEWDPPEGGVAPFAYNIYRGNPQKFIGVVPANGKLKFRSRVSSKKKSYTYYIESIGPKGMHSSPAKIKIKSKRQPPHSSQDSSCAINERRCPCKI